LPNLPHPVKEHQTSCHQSGLAKTVYYITTFRANEPSCQSHVLVHRPVMVGREMYSILDIGCPRHLEGIMIARY